MAKNDSKQNDKPTPRVYKANAVHKRRANRKTPAAGSVRVGTPEMTDASEPIDASELAYTSEPANTPESADTPGVAYVPKPGASVLPEEIDAPKLDTLETVSASEPDVPVVLDTPVHETFSEAATEVFETPEVNASEVVSEAIAETPEALEGNASKPGFSEQDSFDGEFEGDLPDELDADIEKTPKHRKVRLRTVVLTVLAVLVVLAVAAASLFAWNRWGRYNDGEDFKGTWYVQGTAVPVTIDDSLIHLADSVAYSYEIDDRDKTISYSFGDWTGQGRYWFSDDRSTLIITDGSEFTGVGNTADDFAKMLDELKPGGNSSEVDQSQEEGSIALSRTAPTVAFVAQQVIDRIAQEKAAAQEDLDEEAYDYYY